MVSTFSDCSIQVKDNKNRPLVLIKEEGIGSFSFCCFLDQFFGFCAKKLWLFGFGAHCGLF